MFKALWLCIKYPFVELVTGADSSALQMLYHMSFLNDYVVITVRFPNLLVS